LQNLQGHGSIWPSYGDKTTSGEPNWGDHLGRPVVRNLHTTPRDRVQRRAEEARSTSRRAAEIMVAKICGGRVVIGPVMGSKRPLGSPNGDVTLVGPAFEIFTQLHEIESNKGRKRRVRRPKGPRRSWLQKSVGAGSIWPSYGVKTTSGEPKWGCHFGRPGARNLHTTPRARIQRRAEEARSTPQRAAEIVVAKICGGW